MSNLGPASSVTVNTTPIIGNFDAKGNLIQAQGPGGKNIPLAQYALDTSGNVTGLVTPDGVNSYLSTQNFTESVNFSPLNLKHWRKALGNVRNGVANAKVAFIGDSTTAGWYGVTDPTVRSKSHPNQFAKILAGVGIPTGVESFWGNNRLNNSTSLSAFDSRAVMGAWAVAQVSRVTGGGWLTGAAGAPFKWTPAVQVDTFDVYYSGGSFTADIDGGATTPSVVSGVNTKKLTITAALGTHTLNLTYVSGTVTVLAVDAYNSAAKQVSVWNWGAYGVSTNFWATGLNPYEMISSLPFLAPDLSIIDMTINDIGLSVPVATAQANLQLTITACQAVGDVILVVPVPGQLDSTRTQAVISAYAKMIYQLAATNNIPLIDFNRRWENYVAAQAAGLMSDSLHPGTVGYIDKAQTEAKTLLWV